MTWTGNVGQATDAFAPLDVKFAGTWAWDPIAQQFVVYRQDIAPTLNTLNELAPGQALWIRVTEDAIWSQQQSQVLDEIEWAADSASAFSRVSRVSPTVEAPLPDR